MSAKHTPGPWRLTDGSDHLKPGMIVSFHPSVICSSVEDNAYEANANAYLIAAAPDMLKALQAAVGLFNNTFADGGTVHKQMLAAIAKATGGEA